jgi:hypothetical protein
MCTGIFITVTDIAIIKGCHYNTAWKELKTLHTILEKKEHQKVTILEYCQYEGITIDEFNRATNPKKYESNN